MDKGNEVVKVVLVTKSSRRGVNLSVDTTYNKFVTYVVKKFNLRMDIGCSLSYQLHQSDYTMDITDDDELRFFIDAARNSGGKPLEVFVFQPSSSQPIDEIQIPNTHQYCNQLPPPFVNSTSQYPIQLTQFFNTHPQNPNQLPNLQYHDPSNYYSLPLQYQNNVQPFTQYLTNSCSLSRPSKENGVYNSFFPHHSINQSNRTVPTLHESYHDVGTSQHPLYNQSIPNKYEDPEEYAEDLDDDSDPDFGEHDEDKSDTDHGFFIDSEDDNEDVPHKYMSPKDWKDNTFSFMPDPLPQPSQKFKQITLPKIDSNRKVTLTKGVWFVNKAECKKIIAYNSIQEGYEYKVRNSSKTRYDVVCNNDGCDWKIITVCAKNGDAFHVNAINGIHTCSKTQVKTRHRNAGKEVLGDMLMEKMKDPKTVYTPKNIMQDIGTTYHIKISYQQAWRGREHALEKLRGGYSESYAKLPYYFHNLELKNPGTYTDIKTDQYGRFEMCFMMLGVSIRTFLNNLRPLIIVDGAHLKGKSTGSNLLAVGMDGNNQIVPIAYGICSSESGETWTWFMRKLKHCIGDVPGLVFISDRHLGIAQGIGDVFPNAFHGLCCRHILMNLNLPTRDDWAFWRICKAHWVTKFNFFMEQLLEINQRAHEKLSHIDPCRWSRAHSPVNRYNYCTSNCVESVNALSVEARKMPITMIMEFFRGLVQRWSYERRADGVKYEQLGQTLTPYAERKIYKRIRKSNMWRVYGISEARYQVNDTKHDCLVDLERMECSCLQWKHSGLPCGHVIAVYKEIGFTECSNLAKEWFTIQTYKATYAEETYFVGDVSSWVVPENIQNVLPPDRNKRNAGRPKKTSRIPSKGEKARIRVCNRCGADDHKSSQCRVSMTSTKSSFVHPTFDLNE